MVDVGMDFGPDPGARNVGEAPGAWIVGASPGKDSRGTKDEWSPQDEDVYYVFDYYCINLA